MIITNIKQDNSCFAVGYTGDVAISIRNIIIRILGIPFNTNFIQWTRSDFCFFCFYAGIQIIISRIATSK